MELVNMIEYVNSFILLTMSGSTFYVYYSFVYLMSTMDSEILDQLTILEENVEILKSPNPKEAAKTKLTLK